MQALTVTLVTTSVMGLIMIWLAARVIAGRVKGDVIIGDGENADLLYRIRAQGNFAEYTPLFLILLGALELSAGNQTVLMVLAVVFVVARILHVFGMGENANLKFRQIGMIATFLSIAVASIYGLAIALM